MWCPQQSVYNLSSSVARCSNFELKHSVAKKRSHSDLFVVIVNFNLSSLQPHFSSELRKTYELYTHALVENKNKKRMNPLWCHDEIGPCMHPYLPVCFCSALQLASQWLNKEVEWWKGYLHFILRAPFYTRMHAGTRSRWHTLSYKNK